MIPQLKAYVSNALLVMDAKPMCARGISFFLLTPDVMLRPPKCPKLFVLSHNSSSSHASVLMPILMDALLSSPHSNSADSHGSAPGFY